jgi:hypothetical protein
MRYAETHGRPSSIAVMAAIAFLVVGCGSKEPSQPGASQPSAPATEQAAPEAQQVATTAPAETWTAEALEELLAPIALYPDPMLSQVLVASTNPQEVLDAGNWLLENQNLSGKALDDAARQVGFTPPVIALLHFPDTLDMMCREMEWTTSLGQAFQADQAGVLDAIQRLRTQAQAVGNLKTSPEMTVDDETQDGKEVIVIKPGANGEVYVPQYDPVAVYQPAPATTAPATTTTATTQSTGYSTGALITTGLLAFGAGMLVNELFHDDHDHYKYYYPNYGYGRMPYYPPYPYRPVYGHGYYPSHGYYPPPGYRGGYVNNGNIIINTGGNNYWNRWQGAPVATPYGKPRTVSSPITQARPNRSDLAALNTRKPRPMPADVQRPSTAAEPASWKGRSTYAGATGGTKAYKGTERTGSAGAARPMPKIQGSYGGAPQGTYKGATSSTKPAMARPETRKTAQPSPAAVAKPAQARSGDRGYARPSATPQAETRNMQSQASRPQMNRPVAQTGGGQREGRNSAMSGMDRGSADLAASQRGRQSLPQGAESKGAGRTGSSKKARR